MESEGTIDKPITCHQCGADFTMRQLIMAVDDYCYRSLSVVVAKTPCCQLRQEIWLRNGLASRGYVYGAGQAHFADMEQYDAPDMVVIYSPEQILIQLGDHKQAVNRY